MIQLVALYLLVGTVIGFVFELLIRWTDGNVNLGERIAIITLWPLMILVFLFNFIKGFFL